MFGRRLGLGGLWIMAVLLWLGSTAWAGAPVWVQGLYEGKAMLAKEDAGPQAPRQATAIKFELRQAGDKLTGSLIVGSGKPEDQIVLEITKGEVQDDFLWFQGEEMIWLCQFSGQFKNNQILGDIIFVNQNPADKLLGKDKTKSFKPAKLAGPLDVRRR